MKSGLWKSALLLALGSFGCKTTELSDNTSTALDATGSARHRILLVGAGGWGSCGSGGDPFTQRIWDSFRTLAEDVGKKTDVDYMIACLNNISPAKNAANLWYGAQGMPVYKIKSRDFPYYVQQHIKLTRPTQVYMIGHSYGGWVVMNLAEAGVKSTAMFGLDPIDASYCLPSSNFFLGLGIESAKCKMAPYMNYAAIGAATQKFYQLWQPLGPIHSVPIDRTFVVNHQFDINHDSFGGYMSEKTAYAHRMIGSEPSAWGVACHTIFKLNQWNQSDCRMIETDGDGRFEAYVTPAVPVLDISGISIPDPATIPAPASRYTCTKTPQGPNGPIDWRVSVVKGQAGWHIDAKRSGQHLYDEKETTRVLGQELTENDLTNFVHSSKTLWLSLKPVGSGNYVGRFYTQKYNYDIKDMDCREGI